MLPHPRRKSLRKEIDTHVEPGSMVYSDALASYNDLNYDYIHNVINHAEKYVDGNVHTNGIENFWSLLKRTIGGTYISVEPFHLFRYLDEQAFGSTTANTSRTRIASRWRSRASSAVV